MKQSKSLKCKALFYFNNERGGIIENKSKDLVKLLRWGTYTRVMFNKKQVTNILIVVINNVFLDITSIIIYGGDRKWEAKKLIVTIFNL